MILKLGMKHQGMHGALKIYMDDLDLFCGKVNLGRPCI